MKHEESRALLSDYAFKWSRPSIVGAGSYETTIPEVIAARAGAGCAGIAVEQASDREQVASFHLNPLPGDEEHLRSVFAELGAELRPLDLQSFRDAYACEMRHARERARSR